MKVLEPRVLLTKHFSLEYLKNHLSKSFRVEAKDFIIRDFVPIEEIQKEYLQEKHFILTSKYATQYILQLPIKGEFYCVGDSSANLLKNAGKKVIVVKEDAKSLAEWLIQNFNPSQKLVYFCSHIRGNTLPNALKQNHMMLKEIVTYKTLPASITELKDYDAYVFFSPSGVKSFHQKNKIQEKATIFAIGETTRMAIKELGYSTVMIPEKPNTEDLFKKIQNYYGY